MTKLNHNLMPRHLAISAAISVFLGLGAVASGAQAALGIAHPGAEVPIILAGTEGMERRGDNRDNRQEDRGDRQDNRQDCRQEEGAAGGDKRDCKQEGRDEPEQQSGLPMMLAAGADTRVERRHDAVQNTADRVDDKQDFREERRDCVGEGPDCRSDNRQDKRQDTVDRAEDRVDDRRDRR